QAGAVQTMGGVRLVAAGALGVKDLPANGLGGVESQLGIGLSGFGVATGKGKQSEGAEQRQGRTTSEQEIRAQVSWHGRNQVPSYRNGHPGQKRPRSGFARGRGTRTGGEPA